MRREQCEKAAEILGEKFLRDVPRQKLEGEIPSQLMRHMMNRPPTLKNLVLKTYFL